MHQRRYISQVIRRQIAFIAGKECSECGRAIDGEALMGHLDHIVPFSAGGESVVFNLQQLCQECNLRKGARLTEPGQQLLLLQDRRCAELAAYFQNTPVNIIGNERLRQPQSEAYLAIRDYFSEEPSLPAIVEVPTGCGKTGIVCIAPFGVSKGRILVVTPNLTIKRTIEKTLSPLDKNNLPNRDNFYLKCHIFPNPNDLPKFVVLKQGQANCEDCLRADIVVVNIQQMQGWLSLFPSDFFDMVIVDEAHHVPAESWRKVNQAFSNAKKLYLTATPFRSDNKPIVAEMIYRYSLAEAISKSYVKNVMKVDARPSLMTFTVLGERREFTYDEIMEMREELWFSKGVALSEVCNQTIVDQSIGILVEKRKSGIAHQIIAAACSKDHAIQLVALYQSRAIRATYVISEEMSLEERERRMQDFESGRYDCIVHVGILGEGYDNANISIAAVFRPYRSLSPYAQFVGRTLRRLAGGSPDDNIAHVVAHGGLNLDRLWEYFKSETREAAILSYIDEIDHEVERERPRPERDRESFAQVTGEVIERFDVDTFLPVPGLDTRYIAEAIQQVDAILTALKEQGIRIPTQTVREQLTALNRPMGVTPLPSPVNRPDLERKQYRLWLQKEIQRAAGLVMFRLELPTDASLVTVIGNGDERNNYEVVVSAMHRAVNRMMGKGESNSRRNDWALNELKEARKLVPQTRDVVLDEIRQKLNNA
jgi:DNA repair protein RadD